MILPHPAQLETRSSSLAPTAPTLHTSLPVHLLRNDTDGNHRLAHAMSWPQRCAVARESIRQLADPYKPPPHHGPQPPFARHPGQLFQVRRLDCLHECVRLLGAPAAAAAGRADNSAQIARHALRLWVGQRHSNQLAARIEQLPPPRPADGVNNLVILRVSCRHRLDTLLPVVYHHVRPHGAHHLDVLGRAHAGHVRAHRLGQLHRKGADAARRAVDQDAATVRHRAPCAQGLQRRLTRGWECRSRLPVDAFRLQHDIFRRHANVLGKCPARNVCGPKNLVSWREVVGTDVGAERLDNAREVHPRDRTPADGEPDDVRPAGEHVMVSRMD
mmetsp:Transcript_12162/g.28198  ORF Transcript_12162/g.28198 Transcript_12162/m.28198 type:complete len:330 (+) Transcript_12162:74-1063(+)|eukprot:CAMPEP_0119375442 /NCGR_PEP_ID=MMETSP1334-20130426/35912_1 /TAXON_ID=127549 /ORGANISM="Calcidiscus leptoporus, Strain RCC1130" /LENGTH=329 /DNA_ID=CAMNT_0007393759 /DNA_START=59 /DNA_END=1048 /DNA_ORIENTATION=+